MNEPQLLGNANTDEVASLLIPMDGRQLLLPTVTVAEMVAYRQPQRDPEAPDWYLGDINWRDQPVPVLCYELLNGDSLPGFTQKSRIAVLNNTGISESLPFIALATQGIPRLSRVKSEEIHEKNDAQLKAFDLMAVSHAGEALIIPNVSALEQAFLDYQNTQ